MVQFNAFRRLLGFIGLVTCAAAVPLATPAAARPAHRVAHYGHAHHHVPRHYAAVRHGSRFARVRHGTEPTYRKNFAIAGTGTAAPTAASQGFGSSNIVDEARHYIGGNPAGRGRLWCARFMNMVLRRTGHKGTGSDMARSFASYGQRISGPQVGAIAVMGRAGGGHVGVVSGIDANGNPILVSGNNGNRVREAAIPRGRIYAYVMPTS
jgi:uncharacterized protein (TIGR02594 family)